jgi:acyl dehydratase
MAASEVYRVTARNAATRSENRIHDDRVARDYGFGGGLVPGVTLYGYLTRPVVAHFGRSWLERGSIDVRFGRPVYDGGAVEVRAETDGSGNLNLGLVDDGGTQCVTGQAARCDRAWAAGALPFDPAEVGFAERAPERPPADRESLAPGTTLGTIVEPVRSERNQGYRLLVEDDLDLYAREGLAHPGVLILTANTVLAANVAMGPWVHVGSRVFHLGLVPAEAVVETRARVRDRYERKGHELVELDVVWRHDGRPVMAAVHTAIYKLRS